MTQKKKIKAMFYIPSARTIYAGRTILNGYKNAFIDLGHDFSVVSSEDDIEKKIDEFQPDIFLTSFNSFALRFLDLETISRHRKRGMKVFVNLPFWTSPVSKFRVNETPSLSQNKAYIDLIKSGDFGDVYYNVCEQGDPRMEGFEEATGNRYHTIPLAADSIALKGTDREEFRADISFIGTNLPAKREYFKKMVFPLTKKYDLRLYGQDWTLSDRILGWAQRAGQYLNLPYLRSLRKPKLQLSDEADIYKSSRISINIHEDYQREFGGDCNERTFKIPFCGGFEITDDVACIRKYLIPGKEIIIAENETDWFDKIDYYMKNPDERNKIIEAGKARVLAEHTYHHRVKKMIGLYNIF